MIKARLPRLDKSDGAERLLNAQNVFVGAGARITTVLPPGGLKGYSNAINNLSLTLDASGSIVDNGAIASASNLTALAGEMFSNQAVVSSSGLGTGRDAGDITIIAGSINLQGVVLAVGSNGANGPDASLPGQSGTDGQDGGKGGMITLQGTGGITINANIQADEGNGGNGGRGGDGASQRRREAAPAETESNGGRAGTISLTTTDAAINQAAGLSISAVGGSGGSGGAGGNGGAASTTSSGAGGRGGNGGMATAGGRLSADSGEGSLNFSSTLSFNGGSGGGGGAGGNGGDGSAADFAGGVGGDTGASQSGAMGGMLALKNTSGPIIPNSPMVMRSRQTSAPRHRLIPSAVRLSKPAKIEAD